MTKKFVPQISCNFNLFLFSGVPYINSSWWAWIESCQRKSRSYIWSKLESCPRLAGPRQVVSFWTEAACCGFPPSCSWFFWGTCLFPSSVQTAAVKYCCFREDRKPVFWRRSGSLFSMEGLVCGSHISLGFFYLYWKIQSFSLCFVGIFRIAKNFRVSFLVSAICSVIYLISFLPVKSLNYMRNRERVMDNALLQCKSCLNLGPVSFILTKQL